MSLSDKLDFLSLTSLFSGELNLVKMKMTTSPSRAPPLSFQVNTLFSKALPFRNPSHTTGS
jgi:hypothetical protein